MAIATAELHRSREYTKGKNLEMVYEVTGTADEAAAITAVEAVRPATKNDLIAGSPTAEPVLIDEDNADICIWHVTVPYTSPDRPDSETYESTYQFDITGETQHITQALASIARYAPSGETAADFSGAINVSDDGIDGADIFAGAFAFSETHYFDDSTITSAYKSTLAGLAFKVNDASFRGFAAGEVLFTGANGTRRGSGKWEITYNFRVLPNATGLTVGSITGIAKKGWELMWVRYRPEKDATANVIVRVPESVHIEQVYDTASFTGIGIGTGV